MINNSKYFFTLYKCTNMSNMLRKAVEVRNKLFKNELQNLNIADYYYTPDEAIEELGLELELVNHLIEDYVTQIIKSNMTFVQYLEQLKNDADKSIVMDYTPLRELAHKNLGVARNLRIYDAEKLLYKIMKEDDLDYIFICLEGLFACVTILRPKEAFDALRLIKIKNSF